MTTLISLEGKGHEEVTRGATCSVFVGLWWSGALKRCDGASLEALAQRIDAHGGVGTVALPVEAAEHVLRQAAQEKARER